MSVRIKNYCFSKISEDFKIGLKDYKNLYAEGKPLKDLLENKNYILDIQSGRTPSKFNEDYWNGEYDFITMSDINALTYTINDIVKEKITDDAIENEKNLVKVSKGSFIVSNAMTIGLAFISNKDVYINQNVFWVKLDRNVTNIKFLLWYFNTYIRKIFQKVYSAKYLSKQELSRINIPDVDLEKQNEFEIKIKPYEDEINNLKSLIVDAEKIINKVFSKYFDYDPNIMQKVHKGMSYGTQKDGSIDKNISYISFSNIKDSNYRLSTRNNSLIYNKIYSKILEKPYKKISNITLELVKGVQPIYAEEGTKVIKIANLKNSKIDFENTEYAKEEYCRALQKNKYLQIDDIIICCTGKGSLGKIDIVENDEDAITAVDNYILRIDTNKYNPKFLTYYLRSILGVIQFEMNYTGMTNQIHFYDVNISNILIPDVNLECQENIVKEIEDEINNQNEIRNKVNLIRNQINKILENIIEE